MIVDPSDKIFNEMFYWMFIRRGDLKAKHFNCYLSASILAYYFSEIEGRVFIVETPYHAVLYDGQSTWDLNMGIMFKNYRYPNIKLPEYTIIPKFHRFFVQELYDYYYSPETLRKSVDNITIKTVIS